MSKLEKLKSKWYDFGDYGERDYREVFNHEALWVDEDFEDTIYFVECNLDYKLERLKLDKSEVMNKIKEDLLAVGYEHMGIGFTVKPINEW